MEIIGLTRAACRKDIPSPLHLSTVSSGKADEIFRQIFLQCTAPALQVLKDYNSVYATAVDASNYMSHAHLMRNAFV